MFKKTMKQQIQLWLSSKNSIDYKNQLFANTFQKIERKWFESIKKSSIVVSNTKKKVILSSY